ncbi:MAG: hypothetical protein Kow00121_26030 [Elainellaceae cyanobacterium]
MSLVFADPTEWWLDLSSTTQTITWQASQSYSSAHSRWNAYLNQICLDTLLAWMQTDYASDAHSALSPEALAELWEVVTGSVIQVGTARFVLLPSENVDNAELEVPQEWVDIPDWAGDYYLAVQMRLEPDDRHLRVWGYATHQQLKTQGHYDPDDRTYGLDANNLTCDLSTLWVTVQFCPGAQTQAAIAPLPALAEAQVNQLIQRLSNVSTPRLAIPFPMWGALLAQPQWRHRLYQQRTQSSSGVAGAVRLGQWLQNQFEAGWQSLEAVFGQEATLALGWRSAVPAQQATRAKVVEFAAASNLSIVLLLQLETDGDRVAITVQLYPLPNQTVIPAGVTLALLSGVGEVLQSVQTTGQDDYVQLRRFRCPSETEFQLQVTWEGNTMTEAFRV